MFEARTPRCQMLSRALVEAVEAKAKRVVLTEGFLNRQTCRGHSLSPRSIT